MEVMTRHQRVGTEELPTAERSKYERILHQTEQNIDEEACSGCNAR